MPTEVKSIFGAKKIDSAAVDDLSFSLKKGEVLSLLGPNGCGKTTTLRMLAGMLEPSKGTAFIDEIDAREQKQKIKSKIGFMTNNTTQNHRKNDVQTIKFFLFSFQLIMSFLTL